MPAAALCALIATSLLGASLNGGEWVNAHREATEGTGEDANSLVVDFGFGPQGLHYRVQIGFRSTVVVVPIEHINHTWTHVEDLFNPKHAPHLTGVALQSLLYASRNTMIAGVRTPHLASKSPTVHRPHSSPLCRPPPPSGHPLSNRSALTSCSQVVAAAIALVAVVVCASTQLGKFVDVSDRVVFILTAASTGMLALASILAFASFGTVNSSEVRSSFVEEWNKVPEQVDMEILVLSSGNASAMDQAAAGAVFAGFAAALLAYLAVAARSETKPMEGGHLIPA